MTKKCMKPRCLFRKTYTWRKRDDFKSGFAQRMVFENLWRKEGNFSIVWREKDHCKILRCVDFLNTPIEDEKYIFILYG